MYIKVTPNGNTSLEQAKLLSMELQRISRPNADTVTKYRYGWITKGDETILVIDADDMIPVGDGVDLTNLLAAMSNINGEKAPLAAYIQSLVGQKVRFGDIIPSAVSVYTKNQLKAEGWDL